MSAIVPPSTCAICLGRWPLADHRVAEFETSVVSLHEDQFFPGWCVLVAKRHVTELFQLAEAERRLMIEEVTRVAVALNEAFRPVKINYACLGNQLPHVHWHVVPRLPADPAPTEAIWGVRHEPQRLPPDELHERLSRIRQAL